MIRYLFSCPMCHGKIEVREARKRVDWTSIDWTRTNKELARKLGCSYAAIVKQRAARGFPAPRKWKLPWHKANWTLPDTEIARAVGVSRQMVAVVRNKYNISK